MKSMTITQFIKISLPTAIFALLALVSSCSSTNKSQKVEAQIAPSIESTVSKPTKSVKSVPTKKPVISLGKLTNTNVIPEVALANHLKQKGAKMYSTYWCKFCNWQEQQFGTQAIQIIKANIRVECDPRGKKPQTELCDRSNIRIFPTWQINGRLYEGGIPLKELADISGYRGPRNFKTSGN